MCASKCEFSSVSWLDKFIIVVLQAGDGTTTALSRIFNLGRNWTRCGDILSDRTSFWRQNVLKNVISVTANKLCSCFYRAQVRTESWRTICSRHTDISSCVAAGSGILSRWQWPQKGPIFGGNSGHHQSTAAVATLECIFI